MCNFGTADECSLDQWLVKELLEGLEGEDIDVTVETWRRLEQEALRQAQSMFQSP